MANLSRVATLVSVILMVAHTTAATMQSGEQWSPCTNFASDVLQTSELVFQVKNSSIMVYPVIDGTPYEAASLNMTMLGFQELSSWRTNPICAQPVSPVTNDSFIGSGYLYQTLFHSDCNCSSQLVVDTIPGTSVGRQTIVVNVTNPAFPNMIMSYNFSLANSTYQTTVTGDSNTNYTDVLLEYKPNFIKLTISIENWPWLGPAAPTSGPYGVGPSYLVMYMSGAVKPAHYSNVTWDITNIDYQLSVDPVYTDAQDPNPFVGFYVSLDRSFFLDVGSGLQPYLNSYPATGWKTTAPAGFDWYLPSPFTYCYQYSPGHWTSLLWDPQITVLFGGDQTPGTPSVHDKSWIAAPIIVPIVVVAVVAFIVVYSQTSFLQKIFQPFKRVPDQHEPLQKEYVSDSSNSDVEASQSPQSKWTKAKVEH